MTLPVQRGTATTNGATSNPTTLTLTKPTGVVDNDGVLVAMSGDGNLTASLSGWSVALKRLSTDSDQTLVVLNHVAASDGASYVFNTSGAFAIGAICVAYSGILTSAMINAIAAAVSGSDTTASPQNAQAPSIDTTLTDCMRLFVGTVDVNSITSATWAPPATFTELADYLDPATICPITVAAVGQAAAGATGTATGVCTSGVQGEWVAIQLALASADGVGGGGSGRGPQLKNLSALRAVARASQM
jgi:hypothetical protein